MKKSFVVKNTKKVFSVLLMLAIFCVSFVPCVYAASKSRYASTLSFDTTCTGATRYYNGNHIQISLYTRPTNMSNDKFSKSKYSKNYYITLYRKGWFWHTDKVGIGRATILKNSTIKWSNVGSGNYYFFFSKERNGINIASNNVVMKNY